jgi:hypothetical protein
MLATKRYASKEFKTSIARQNLMRKRSILIVCEHFEENFNEARRSLKYFTKSQPIGRK